MCPLGTRTENDTLNMGLEGPMGCTKKVPDLFPTYRNGSCKLLIPHLSQNKQLPLYCLFLLTRTQSCSQTSGGTGTYDYTDYFNISAQTQISTHLTPRYQTIHVSALYALHCETFWFSASEKFNIKQTCKETDN